MDILVVIGVIFGGVLLWLQGKKGRDTKKFWSGVKEAITEAQEEEDQHNQSIDELEDELIDVEVDLEDVEDADITPSEAIDLLIDRFGWDRPSSDDK